MNHDDTSESVIHSEIAPQSAGESVQARAAQPPPRGPARAVGREMFTCPHCGHPLSMFTERDATRAERIAARLADAVGSWPFLLILIVAITGWCLTTLIVRLFDPHPSAALNYLGTALAVVAAFQGPLILLTQRRESERDRARDVEAFNIAQKTEAILHSLSHAVASTAQHPDPNTPHRSGILSEHGPSGALPLEGPTPIRDA